MDAGRFSSRSIKKIDISSDNMIIAREGVAGNVSAFRNHSHKINMKRQMWK